MAGASTTRGGDRDHTPEPLPGASPERMPRPRSLAEGTGQMDARSAAAEEDSGLIDIRNMARQTRRRVSDRMSTESEVEESLLASSRPSALRDVVLPEPGKEQPMRSVPAAMVTEAGVGAAAEVAIDAPPRRKRGLFAVVALAVLGAGGAAAWYATQGGAAQGATETIASAPAAQGAAGADGLEPPAPADDSAEPGGLVPADDEAEARAAQQPEADPAPAARAEEPEAAAEPAERVARAERQRDEDRPARSRSRDRANRGRRAEARKDARSDEQPEKVAAKAEPPPAGADLDALLDHAAGGAHEPEARAKAAPKAPSKSSLSRGDIKAGMKTIKARVGGCYESHKAPGVVQVKVTIAPTGVVTSADTVDGKFRGTDTGVCVANAVRAAEFPAWDGAPMTVTYPFLLQ